MARLLPARPQVAGGRAPVPPVSRPGRRRCLFAGCQRRRRQRMPRRRGCDDLRRHPSTAGRQGQRCDPGQHHLPTFAGTPSATDLLGCGEGRRRTLPSEAVEHRVEIRHWCPPLCRAGLQEPAVLGPNAPSPCRPARRSRPRPQPLAAPPGGAARSRCAAAWEADAAPRPAPRSPARAWQRLGFAHPTVRDESVPRAAPPAHGDPPGHRADPGLRVAVPTYRRPALPRPGVRLVHHILRLGGAAGERVEAVEQPLTGLPVEGVEAAFVGMLGRWLADTVWHISCHASPRSQVAQGRRIPRFGPVPTSRLADAAPAVVVTSDGVATRGRQARACGVAASSLPAMGEDRARPRLVLASASPARRRSLQAAGIEPEVVVSGVDESQVDATDPTVVCARLARGKAEAVAAMLRSRGEPRTGQRVLVLGCDSVLALRGRDVRQARRRGGGGGALAPDAR